MREGKRPAKGEHTKALEKGRENRPHGLAIPGQRETLDWKTVLVSLQTLEEMLHGQNVKC